MQASEAARAGDNTDAGRAQYPLSSRSGRLLDHCAIDLPPNDVIESIEFERFFVINARLSELQRPLTLMSVLASSRQEELSASDMVALGAIMPIAALSNKRRDWTLLDPTHGGAKASVRTAGEGVAASTAMALQGALTNPDVVGPEVTAPPMVNLSEARLAFYLPYRQDWALLGYSRGRMVNSLALAPGEEQTIEIFNWDRMSRTLESTNSFEFEQTSESTGTRRDTTDVSKEITKQAGFEMTANGKVGFKIDVVTADFSTTMNAATALNDIDKNARQTITEGTSRAAQTVRSSRTLKVVETRESGQETRVTRKLRNPNSCHTLVTIFFEVLANYRVSTYLRTDAIRLVVLIKSSDLSKISQFDRRVVRAHERALTLALLDSTLLPGFEAARYLDARDRACSVLCAGCDCGVDTGPGTRDPEWDALKSALAALGRAVASLRTGVFLPVSVALARVPGTAGQGAQGIRRYLFQKALDRHAPRLLADLGGLSLATATPAIADRAMAVIDGVVPGDLDALKTPEGSLKDAVGWDIYVILLAVFVDPVATGIATGALIGAIGGLGSFDDGGLVAAMADVRAKYVAWQARLAARREQDERLAALDRIAREERAMRVLDAFPLRQTAEAQERLEALLDHLNDLPNIDHYRFAVWNERGGTADPQLLALALAGVSDGAPVGMVGDFLAVPLRIPAGSALKTFFNESIAALLSLSPRDDDDHILPTAALYAEAIPGECCACEETILRREALELRERELKNGLLDAEIARRKAKLDAKNLSDPVTTVPFRVELMNNPPATEPAAPEP